MSMGECISTQVRLTLCLIVHTMVARIAQNFDNQNHLQIDGLYEFYKHEIKMRQGEL